MKSSSSIMLFVTERSIVPPKIEYHHNCTSMRGHDSVMLANLQGEIT